MSQTPPFTVYEPPRSLEKEKTMDEKMKMVYTSVNQLNLRAEATTETIGHLLKAIIELEHKVDTLEKKEISER